MIILKCVDKNNGLLQYFNALIQLWNKFVTTCDFHKLLTSLLMFQCSDKEKSGRENSVENWCTFP